MDRITSGAPPGWTPVRVNINNGVPTIDWARIVRPLQDPFFEQTAAVAMAEPFNELFARRTALDALDDRAPAALPAGLIFHMSRCGSTLVAQMLSRMASTVVLSEAQPIDALIRLHRRSGDAGETAFAQRLRALIAALCGTASAGSRVFVKLHAWHVLSLPLLLRALPGVPWLFLFRDPADVLASQERLPGAEVLASFDETLAAGIDPAAAAAMPTMLRTAAMTAAFCEAAVRAADLGRASFVDYATLPGAVFSRILPFFGVRANANDLAAMHRIATRDTKGDGTAFVARLRPERTLPHGDAALASLDASYGSLRNLSSRGITVRPAP